MNLLIPLFPWYGKSYQINRDEDVIGWHMAKISRPVDVWIDDNPQWLLLDAAA